MSLVKWSGHPEPHTVFTSASTLRLVRGLQGLVVSVRGSSQKVRHTGLSLEGRICCSIQHQDSLDKENFKDVLNELCLVTGLGVKCDLFGPSVESLASNLNSSRLQPALLYPARLVSSEAADHKATLGMRPTTDSFAVRHRIIFWTETADADRFMRQRSCPCSRLHGSECSSRCCPCLVPADEIFPATGGTCLSRHHCRRPASPSNLSILSSYLSPQCLEPHPKLHAKMFQPPLLCHGLSWGRTSPELKVERSPSPTLRPIHSTRKRAISAPAARYQHPDDAC